MNFNVSEQDVLRIRAEAARRGLTSVTSSNPVEVGLQTETRLSAYRQARLCRADGRSVDRHARGARRAAERRPVLLPGYFVRVRVPLERQQGALLVPDVALGSDQAGRYLLVVNSENVVEQRKVRDRAARGRSARDRKRPHGGRPGRGRGLQRAIPGQKVDPKLTQIEPSPASAK